MVVGVVKINPISLRPRQASALEKVWIDNNRSAAAMREIIHQWAEEARLANKPKETET